MTNEDTALTEEEDEHVLTDKQVADMRQDFHHRTGLTPEEWLKKCRAGEIEHQYSLENLGYHYRALLLEETDEEAEEQFETLWREIGLVIIEQFPDCWHQWDANGARAYLVLRRRGVEWYVCWEHRPGELHKIVAQQKSADGSEEPLDRVITTKEEAIELARKILPEFNELPNTLRLHEIDPGDKIRLPGGHVLMAVDGCCDKPTFYDIATGRQYEEELDAEMDYWCVNRQYLPSRASRYDS